jgi:hypothetical protein
MKRLLVISLLLLLTLNARATTCNGTANPCDAASASYADVNAAVLLTPRNGNLRVPAGTDRLGHQLTHSDEGN